MLLWWFCQRRLIGRAPHPPDRLSLVGMTDCELCFNPISSLPSWPLDHVYTITKIIIISCNFQPAFILYRWMYVQQLVLLQSRSEASCPGRPLVEAESIASPWSWRNTDLLLSPLQTAVLGLAVLSRLIFASMRVKVIHCSHLVHRDRWGTGNLSPDTEVTLTVKIWPQPATKKSIYSFMFNKCDKNSSLMHNAWLFFTFCIILLRTTGVYLLTLSSILTYLSKKKRPKLTPGCDFFNWRHIFFSCLPLVSQITHEYLVPCALELIRYGGNNRSIFIIFLSMAEYPKII